MKPTLLQSFIPINRRSFRTIVVGILGLALAARLYAQSSAFTYQGRLVDNGTAANGSYDVTSALFVTSSGGSPVFPPITNSAVTVNNGVFTVLLDFGSSIFDGTDYFLEMGVRPAGVGPFTTLNPRQSITPSPYAIHAGTAGQLSNGAVSRLNSLQGNVTVSAGQNVTITPLGNNLTIAAPAVNPWATVGTTNIAYSAGNVGIGTASPQAKLHVKGAEEGIRIQGPGGNAPNLAYLSFADLAGTRMGYVGDGSTGDNSIFLTSDSADVVLNTPAGRVLTATATGSVGIGTTTPQAKLDVRGDVKLGASGQFFAPAGEENLRIVRGVFGASGSTIVGSGFSVSRITTGQYSVSFNTAFSGAPTVTAVADEADTALAYVMTKGVTSGGATLWVFDGSNFQNLPVHFVAVGPR